MLRISGLFQKVLDGGEEELDDDEKFITTYPMAYLSAALVSELSDKSIKALVECLNGYLITIDNSENEE